MLYGSCTDREEGGGEGDNNLKLIDRRKEEGLSTNGKKEEGKGGGEGSIENIPALPGSNTKIIHWVRFNLHLHVIERSQKGRDLQI